MNTFARRLRRLADALYTLAGAAAALCVVAMFFLILAQIIARQVDRHIPSSGDMIGFCVVWSAFLGLAYTMHCRAHIRVELFLARLLTRQRRYVNISSGVLATVMVAVFIFHAFALIRESFVFADVTDGEVPLPLWLVQLPMLAGTVLFALSLLDYTLTEIFVCEKRRTSGRSADRS